MVHMRALLLSLCAVICLSPAVAQDLPTTATLTAAANLEKNVDHQLANWSSLIRNDKYTDAIASVEADLRSGHPNEWAIRYWEALHAADMDAALKAASPDIRQALGQAGEICALEFADKNAELIRRFPPASITTQNPSAMAQLISAATNLGDYATALAYYQKLAPANAESFQAVWEGMDFVDDLRYRPALAQMIAPGGSLAGSSTARFFSLIMQQRPALDLDIAQATNQWLAAHPGDGYALYYLALRWQTIGWRDGARAAAKAAYQAQPIYGDAEIAQLIRDSDFEGAKRIQLQQTRLRGTAEANVEHSLAAAFGSDLIQQGEKGEARKVLAPALKQWPQDKALLAQMSRLETASKRPAEALRWAELYRGQDATSINPEVVWIKALTAANKPADALAEFNRALPQFPDATSALYGAGMDAAMAMKQYDDYLRIVRDGSAKFPGLAWLQADESLAQHNLSRDEDALATLTKLFDIQVPDTWDVQHYRLYEDAVNGSKGGEKTAAAMLALRQRFPWAEAVWVDLNAHLSGSNVDADRIALWTQAMAGNPDAGWACERKVGALHGMYQFKESEKLVADCLTAARKLSPGTLAEALDNLLWDSSVVEINIQDARTVAQAELPFLQQFRDLTGDTATYYLRHYQVMETLERSHEAALDLVERVKLQPDSDVFHGLWNDGLVKEIGTGHAYRLAQRAVDRDPYNGDRLHDMVELNAQWQGSPINAWVWLLREKEVAPARFASDQRLLGMIYQGLGDTKEHFDKSYVECGCNGIASSGRYVAWYENAVANAQSGTIAAYPPDPDTHAVKLVYPDGTTMLRRDHPLSGNPEMLKVGPVALEIAYDEWGENMKTVHTPDGQLIEMTYTGDGKLKTVRRNQGPTVEFSYDDKGEPKVRLATDAAIKDASAKAGESKEENSSAAIHEVTAFLPILNMLESWTKSPRSNTPPEPPNNDHERDRLQDATVRTAELKGPGSKESVDAATTLLAYLIKHLGDNRENAKTAYALIEETDEAATKTDATPQQVRAALDDVPYQLSVLQITRPEGLDAREWTAWAAKRAWVNTLALSGKSEAPAAQAAVASMDAAGLKLMKAARWLPNSYISSQGFWRRYSASDLNTRQMDFRAILVRKNGDVVTGGRSGLTVLHRGFWQTYTFDEARHQLTNDAGALPTAWSNVQAIAETGDETLWVATLEGVYALSGKEYTVPATTVIANADLPCGSVTSLAFGKALVMGTLNGVCVMNAGNPQPVAALAAAPVLFLRAVSADNATVVLAGTQQGLFSIDGSNAEKLDDSTVDDAIWMPAEERLYTLRNRRSVFSAEWKGKGTPGPAAPLDDQQDIVQAGIVHGFTPVSLDEHTEAVAVLTDRGLSIWNDGHFEFQSLPLATREPDVRFGSTAADNSYFVTSEGIYALERGQTMGDTDGRVYDLLAANDLGLTYVARGGGGLEVVDQAHPELGARSLEHVDSTHLARDAAGNLYTNDGLTILMYAPKQTVSRELFTCSENPLDNEANSVTAILAASDGTLWVTAGASVYRWRPGMKEPEEYSIFNRTADEFPAQSDWLWNVVELNDHRIWVIASDEGHLSYKGMAMFGGVVEWAGGKFIRVTMPKDEPGWFIDSYTQIEPGLAILELVS
jgi:YD repeat-containing protein